MTLIQCKTGPTTTTVGNENYAFERDGHGRAVCNVRNLRHEAILLGLDLYSVAADLGPVVVNPADPAALAALEARCNQLVLDLGTAEAALDKVKGQLADEREISAGLRRQLAAAPPPPAATAPAGATASQTAQTDALSGSDSQPNFIVLGDTSYPLGDIVAKSQDESGLTVEAWNALTQPEREARIAATIEIMRTPPPADNLKEISGIGPSAEKRLIAAGIVSFKQIADMTPEELLQLDKSLGLGGISERSGWLDQAKALVAKAAATGSTATTGA